MDVEETAGIAESSQIKRLRKKVARSRQVHRIADDPYLRVVELDRMRASITRAMWLLLAVGLAFTTTGVHDYIAAGLTMADPMWWGGWAVEPTFAGLLITILRWETIMLSRGVAVGSGWVRGTKYMLLISTLLMNVLAGFTKGGVFVLLHLIIPALVFCLAEVMPVIQDRFTTARDKILAEIKTSETDRASATTSPPATVADFHAEIGSAPAPISPTLPPVTTTPTAPTPPANLTRPKLPPAILADLEAKASVLAAEGKTITASEVQAVIRISDSMAEKAAKYFSAAHAAK